MMPAIRSRSTNASVFVRRQFTRRTYAQYLRSRTSVGLGFNRTLNRIRARRLAAAVILAPNPARAQDSRVVVDDDRLPGRSGELCRTRLAPSIKAPPALASSYSTGTEESSPSLKKSTSRSSQRPDVSNTTPKKSAPHAGSHQRSNASKRTAPERPVGSRHYESARNNHPVESKYGRACL